jgi:hypothetical protein
MPLNRDEVLATQRPSLDVECPELGGTVRVRTLTLRHLREIYPALRDAPGDVSAELVCAAAVDADGSPLFAPEDLEAVREMHPAALVRIATAAAKLNGFDKTTEDIAGK